MHVNANIVENPVPGLSEQYKSDVTHNYDKQNEGHAPGGLLLRNDCLGDGAQLPDRLWPLLRLLLVKQASVLIPQNHGE